MHSGWCFILRFRLPDSVFVSVEVYHTLSLHLLLRLLPCLLLNGLGMLRFFHSLEYVLILLRLSNQSFQVHIRSSRSTFLQSACDVSTRARRLLLAWPVETYKPFRYDIIIRVEISFLYEVVQQVISLKFGL